jgi:hypothetical protein
MNGYACSLHVQATDLALRFVRGESMNSRRFDTLTRSLARNLPRRGLLRGAAAAATAIAATRVNGTRAMSHEAEGADTVELPCVPCNCVGDDCACCIVGVTGGGILRTTGGDVNVILFATQLAADAGQPAAGFVRWLDPTTDGGLTLESIGPISYDWPEGEEHRRFVHGIMAVNGGEEHPFLLEVFDAGPEKSGEDTARLKVGDSASGGFAYEAEGTVVGGDIQLLSNVAPISQ